jgi:hypothetical protein
LNVRPLRDGFHTVVPKHALTGPVAVVKLDADLTSVRALVDGYAKSYRDEWLFSIFSFVRMDHWDYPSAFEPPILKIGECRDAPKLPPEPHPHTPSKPEQPRQPKPGEPHPDHPTDLQQPKPGEPQPNTPTELRPGPFPGQPILPANPTGGQLQGIHDPSMPHQHHHYTPGDHSQGDDQ